MGAQAAGDYLSFTASTLSTAPPNLMDQWQCWNQGVDLDDSTKQLNIETQCGGSIH